MERWGGEVVRWWSSEAVGRWGVEQHFYNNGAELDRKRAWSGAWCIGEDASEEERKADTREPKVVF